jgi:RimJ/RimL family protein N-acetyltransferase
MVAALLSRAVLLVPYESHHVPLYHRWMQNPALLEATASEPLTLDEEYAMQRSWRTDADKLTFITCIAPSEEESRAYKAEGKAGKWDGDESMLGDVNLFVHDQPSDDDDNNDGDSSHAPRKEKGAKRKLFGEVEIMIAKTDLQGRGLGREVLRTFLWYVVQHQHAICDEFVSRGAKGEKKPATLEYLRVLIGQENERSLKLFERAGFNRIGDVNYFGEVELKMDLAGVEADATSQSEGDKIDILKYSAGDS